MNIKNLIIAAASQYPDKPALIFNDTPVNFRVLKENSFKVATYLGARGITKSDRVALYLPNLPETIFSFFGAFSIGAAIVPLDYMLTEVEVINLINHAEAKVLVIVPKKDVSIESIKTQCPTLTTIIVCNDDASGYSTFDQLLDQTAPAIPLQTIDENKLAAIFYTSGSTGHPKGVSLSGKNFGSPIKTLCSLPLSKDTVTLCAGIPFSHLGGFVYLLQMIYLKQTLVLLERFHPLEALKAIDRYKVTFVWMVPSMYVAILSLKSYDMFNLDSLKLVCVFGAPSAPRLLKKFHTICPGAHFFNGWGMTETTGPSCFGSLGIDNVASIGTFMSDLEVRIVDEEGTAFSSNQAGELWVRGECVMLGYYKEEEMTRETLTSEGWLKTGDIAKVDSEGLYYIVGRKKDMIKVAGAIVFLPEIEAAIQGYPDVQEVAVIGVHDELRGEVPKAFIVARPEQKIDITKLREFLKENLAHFKIPHYFECVREIPKTGPGKIDKKKLQKMSV